MSFKSRLRLGLATPKSGMGAQRSRRRSAAQQISGMNAYGFPALPGQQWWHRIRRHQRWTTRHPIRFQECADRRPLLQQSCSDLRFPGPARITRCAVPGAPGLAETDRMDAMAPGAAFRSSAPNPSLRSPNNQETLTLLAGIAWRLIWNLVPGRLHHPSRPSSPRRFSPDPFNHDLKAPPSIPSGQQGWRRYWGHNPMSARSFAGSGFFMVRGAVV